MAWCFPRRSSERGREDRHNSELREIHAPQQVLEPRIRAQIIELRMNLKKCHNNGTKLRSIVVPGGSLAGTRYMPPHAGPLAPR